MLDTFEEYRGDLPDGAKETVTRSDLGLLSFIAGKVISAEQGAVAVPEDFGPEQELALQELISALGSFGHALQSLQAKAQLGR